MIQTTTKLKTPRELVLVWYPTATATKVQNHYEIIDANGQYLGQGGTRKQAWKAAYNNNVR